MSMKRITFILPFLGLALLGFSCGSRTVTRQYYVIEFPVARDSAALARTPLSSGYCEIAPLEIAPAYAQKRIAVRIGTHELNYYQEHEWAVRPDEAIAAQVEDYLQSRRLFTMVSSRLGRETPHYELYTRIHQLEAIDQKNRLLAHLRLDWELYDRVSGERVVLHSFNESQILQKRNINLLAAAVSGILKAELAHFGDKIEAYLQENRAAAPALPGQD